MKNRFTVTITDFRGARHYSLHQIAKRFALVLACFLSLLLLGGAAAIYVLNHQIQELDTMRAEKAALARSIEQRNEQLRELAAQRQQKIQHLDHELGRIESLVGLESGSGGAQEREKRLAALSQTALVKGWMLRTIPNGWPVADSRITSGYGWRNHPVTGERSFHAAVDLSAGRGTAVVATADGVVNFAGQHRSKLGKLIILQHDLGFRTHYAHLSEVEVEQGEFVQEGTTIARSGATGRVSGPHLHYEVWHIQRKLNPEPFLEWGLRNYEELFEREDRVKWESLAKGIRQRAAGLRQQLSVTAPDSSGS
ncbi:peptidoglycan DD-metalloendopeptidase family protein [Halorhodospira neutriphila]|uniref:Peptidase M23 n=1 Tax=Halorhodospira neutriphila TaxID=168379 RepID=A0ABS1E624_9GAMM|nr:peptidase M23 [Halorhodospira neutriphila]